MLVFIFYLKDQSGHDVPIFPSILPRPNLGFFMIDMLQLKIICWEDRCLVLDADQVYIFFPHMLYFLYMPSVTYLLVHDFSWALSSTTASTDPYGGNCVTWSMLAVTIYSDTSDEVPFHSNWRDTSISDWVVLSSVAFFENLRSDILQIYFNASKKILAGLEGLPVEREISEAC